MMQQQITFFLLSIVLIALLSVPSFASKAQSNGAHLKDSLNSEERFLLPKLPPHPDTCWMLAFVADSMDACDDMEPVVKRLEEDLQIKVRRINVSRRPDLVSLWEAVGGAETGNLPFYYNRRTAQAISGATPYQNLKKLAMGDPSHFFIDVPQSAYEKMEYDPRRQRGVGWGDYVLEKLVPKGRKGKK